MPQNFAGRFNWGNRSFTHPFDGYAKVQRWRFSGGKVAFNTRFLRTNFYNASAKKDTIVPIDLYGNVIPPYTAMEKAEMMMSPTCMPAF